MLKFGTRGAMTQHFSYVYDCVDLCRSWIVHCITVSPVYVLESTYIINQFNNNSNGLRVLRILTKWKN